MYDEEDELEDDDDEDELEEELPSPKSKKKVAKQVKRRFGLTQQIPMRAVDIETQEVLGEADLSDAKSIALMNTQLILDNKERLERIEAQIGAITG